MIFSITDAPSEVLTGMYIYFDDGYPKDHHILTNATSAAEDLIMTPELVSLSPSTGSIAGTRLEITAPGVTVSSTVDVVDASGESVCESVTVEEYGKIACMTKAQEIDSELSILHDEETISWYSRGVPEASDFCPPVPEIYTPEYWQVHYEEYYGIDADTFNTYMLDDLSFDFCAYTLDLTFDFLDESLTEEDCSDYLNEDTGELDWGAYYRDNNNFLTFADTSEYLDSETGEFDWDTYEADQLELMIPETTNEG